MQVGKTILAVGSRWAYRFLVVLEFPYRTNARATRIMQKPLCLLTEGVKFPNRLMGFDQRVGHFWPLRISGVVSKLSCPQ